MRAALSVAGSPLRGSTNSAPSRAKATRWPAATFGAPQTTVCGSPAPDSTVARTRRSALGCGSIESTSATVTRSRSQPPTRSMPSTSAAAIVSRSANASTSRSSGRST